MHADSLITNAALSEILGDRPLSVAELQARLACSAAYPTVGGSVSHAGNRTAAQKDIRGEMLAPYTQMGNTSKLLLRDVLEGISPSIDRSEQQRPVQQPIRRQAGHGDAWQDTAAVSGSGLAEAQLLMQAVLRQNRAVRAHLSGRLQNPKGAALLAVFL